jgi:hypothetical protein
VRYVNTRAARASLLTLRTVWVPNVNTAATAASLLTKCTPTSPTQRS